MPIEYISYGERLRLRRLELQRQRENVPRPLTLAERIKEWEARLSDEDKQRGFSMRDLANLFNVQPSKLGPELFALGWQRRRRWQTGESHCRVWISRD